jgi:hypothetical protein
MIIFHAKRILDAAAKPFYKTDLIIRRVAAVRCEGAVGRTI